jgi:tRNA (Thr-GGU) A37 N-methylase
MEKIKYGPIGIIHSPFKEPKGTPIQPEAAKGADGSVEVFAEYAEGLQDVDGFSHLIFIYHFHLSKKASLKAKPFLDDDVHGVFALKKRIGNHETSH